MARARVMTLHASYLDQPLNNSLALIRTAREVLKTAPKFDTIVGVGLSGALVVPLLARSLRKRFAIVRKADDKSTHSVQPIEGSIGARWIFVDDLVSSGETLRRVRLKVAEVCSGRGHETAYVGTYLYCRPHFCKPGTEEY